MAPVYPQPGVPPAPSDKTHGPSDRTHIPHLQLDVTRDRATPSRYVQGPGVHKLPNKD